MKIWFQRAVRMSRRLAQIDKPQGTVDTYEKTFDEYANQRNAEVKDLNDELSALRKKYAELSAYKMATRL